MPTTDYAVHLQARREQRDAALARLGFGSYADYLRSPHWRDKRAEYRASDRPQGCICGATSVHLHHLTYERIGDESVHDLLALCGMCHALIHSLERQGWTDLDLESFFDVQRAVGNRQRAVERVNPTPTEEHARRHLKRQSDRLRGIVVHAVRERIDVTAELKVIDDSIAALEERVGLTERIVQ